MVFIGIMPKPPTSAHPDPSPERTMIDLVCHESSAAPCVIRVSAAFNEDGALALHYRVDADPQRLRIPESAVPERVEGLWRHTCCEAFVLGEDMPAYREFNFSPSGAWQAYGFSAYRQGGPLDHAVGPAMERGNDAGFSLSVLLPASNLPSGRRLRLGLSAVIEDAAGGLSYWALRHSPGRPDFHHPDCFALELARP
jgi:hypothetical protein